MGMMPREADWAEVLFTRTQRRVLELLFGNPERSYFANEIMRAAGKGVGAVHRELSRLVSAGLVTSTRIGNQRHYRANPQSPVFEEMAAMMAKFAGAARPASGVAETRAAYLVGGNIRVSRKSLDALCRRHHIRRLSLFGSVTRADFGPDSGIDVLVEFIPGRAPGLGGIVELREQISSTFGGRSVEVATPAVLNNPYRRKTIERDLQMLYAAG